MFLGKSSIPYFNSPLAKLSRDVPHDPLSQIKIGIEKGAARSEVFFSASWFLFFFFFLVSAMTCLEDKNVL